MSRASLVRHAVRPALKARLLLSGVGGSGKTTSALVIARELAGTHGSVVVLDTEAQSALTYASEHEFDHLPWDPPYTPQDLVETIRDLSAKYDCIVIDSLSHFWTGEGGTLDIADGKFGGWKVATPAQNDMVEAMLRSAAHIIVCVREKVAYAASEVQKDGRTKQQVEKLGLAPVQREGLDYEFNVAISLNIDHIATLHKSRCPSLPTGTVVKPHHMSDLAKTYGDWLASGVEYIPKEMAESIFNRFKSVEDETKRRELWDAFVALYGKPINVTVDKLDEVGEWLAATIGKPAEVPQGDDYGADRPVGPTPDDAPALPLQGALADALADTEPYDDGEPPHMPTDPTTTDQETSK